MNHAADPTPARPSHDEQSAQIVCDACPVLCRIKEGRSGACDRYANLAGRLTRIDPLVLMAKACAAEESGGAAVAVDPKAWDGQLVGQPVFVSGVGSGTTYPDYKPAPFIVSSELDGVDSVTVVTEGIFSYCSLRIKIDTDRFLGQECATVRYQGEPVGHVTTHEYGSQFLSLGGVHHLTGGGKKEGRLTAELMMILGNKQAAELSIDGGVDLVVQADRAPIVNGHEETRMRVGCGSAAIGMFARQWLGLVDEVIVVDDHITGVLSEHQAGQFLDMPVSGVRLKGRRSTPGRYFQVADPGSGWGGTTITDPLSIIESFDPRKARPGMRLLMVSTTGDDSGWFILDDALVPQPAPMPEPVRRVVERIGENCEPSLASIMFVAGAGGSLRAGVTDNPVMLTRSIKDMLVRVTCGGAPCFIWPGGGITVMADVARMPDGAFGTVPTPAIVAPIEFTMSRENFALLGGHTEQIRSIESVIREARHEVRPWQERNPWPISK